MEEISIDRRVAFCAALFEISTDDLRRVPIDRRVLSPFRFLEFFRARLTADGRTETLIRRAQTRLMKISQQVPVCGVRKISDINQKALMLALMNFEWKVTQLIHNGKCISLPLHVSLTKLTERFIQEWNNLVRKVDRQWLYVYGNIALDQLKITGLSDFIQLIEEVITQKILKSSRISKSNEKYQQHKNVAQVLVNMLKLHSCLRGASVSPIRPSL